MQAVLGTLGAGLWWLAVDTVVDDHGVRTTGGWMRERIAWSQVRRFAVDRATGKPVLVLTDDRRKRLAYVPDAAWTDVQARWQHATASPP